METIPIKLPDVKGIVEETSAAERIAKEIVIDSRESYQRAENLVVAWRALEKKIDATFDPIINSLVATTKIVREKRDENKVPIQRARGIIDPRMVAWDREEKRRQDEERQKREAEARRIAEEARAAEIAEAKKRKDREAVKELKSAPLNVPTVAAPVEKVGTSTHTRATWTAEVVDLAELVKAVAKGKAPLECLEPATTFLNAQARAYKSKLSIAGVKPVKKESLSVRTPKAGDWP
jgi:hypothetical protein